MQTNTQTHKRSRLALAMEIADKRERVLQLQALQWMHGYSITREDRIRDLNKALKQLLETCDVGLTD